MDDARGDAGKAASETAVVQVARLLVAFGIDEEVLPSSPMREDKVDDEADDVDVVFPDALPPRRSIGRNTLVVEETPPDASSADDIALPPPRRRVRPDSVEEDLMLPPPPPRRRQRTGDDEPRSRVVEPSAYALRTAQSIVCEAELDVWSVEHLQASTGVFSTLSSQSPSAASDEGSPLLPLRTGLLIARLTPCPKGGLALVGSSGAQLPCVITGHARLGLLHAVLVAHDFCFLGPAAGVEVIADRCEVILPAAADADADIDALAPWTRPDEPLYARTSHVFGIVRAIGAPCHAPIASGGRASGIVELEAGGRALHVLLRDAAVLDAVPLVRIGACLGVSKVQLSRVREGAVATDEFVCFTTTPASRLVELEERHADCLANGAVAAPAAAAVQLRAMRRAELVSYSAVVHRKVADCVFELDEGRIQLILARHWTPVLALGIGLRRGARVTVHYAHALLDPRGELRALAACGRTRLWIDAPSPLAARGRACGSTGALMEAYARRSSASECGAIAQALRVIKQRFPAHARTHELVAPGGVVEQLRGATAAAASKSDASASLDEFRGHAGVCNAAWRCRSAADGWWRPFELRSLAACMEHPCVLALLSLVAENARDRFEHDEVDSTQLTHGGDGDAPPLLAVVTCDSSDGTLRLTDGVTSLKVALHGVRRIADLVDRLLLVRRFRVVCEQLGAPSAVVAASPQVAAWLASAAPRRHIERYLVIAAEDIAALGARVEQPPCPPPAAASAPELVVLVTHKFAPTPRGLSASDPAAPPTAWAFSFTAVRVTDSVVATATATTAGKATNTALSTAPLEQVLVWVSGPLVALFAQVSIGSLWCLAGAARSRATVRAGWSTLQLNSPSAQLWELTHPPAPLAATACTLRERCLPRILHVDDVWSTSNARSQHVSVRGVVVEKRVCDASSVWMGGVSAAAASPHHRRWLINLRDERRDASAVPSEAGRPGGLLSVYVDVHTSLVPLNIRPGAPVVVHRAVRSQSVRRKNVYLKATLEESLIEVTGQVPRAPPRHPEARENGVGGGEEALASIAAVAPPPALPDAPFVSIASLSHAVGKTPSLVSVRVSLHSVGWLNLRLRCGVCKAFGSRRVVAHGEASRASCARACGAAAATLAVEVDMSCIVDDGSGVAKVNADGALAWQLLGVRRALVARLEAVLLRGAAPQLIFDRDTRGLWRVLGERNRAVSLVDGRGHALKATADSAEVPLTSDEIEAIEIVRSRLYLDRALRVLLTCQPYQRRDKRWDWGGGARDPAHDDPLEMDVFAPLEATLRELGGRFTRVMPIPAAGAQWVEMHCLQTPTLRVRGVRPLSPVDDARMLLMQLARERTQRSVPNDV